ncbi:MAG: hypothetical protein COV67_00735 [Nitrospinae bacterium CG11_big_fil_rev_8_21_14_0_20_56_8]|nr:MAG: hypothetical protein COV67_00735 [Nitrospinae bacterium CG11_big_fil_rev_8_21_14_0_20_56_8]
MKSVIRLHSAIVMVFFLLTGILAGCKGDAPAPGNDPSASAPAQKRKLIVATDTTLIPMSYIDDAGNFAGFEIDLLRKIAERIGTDIDIVSVEWPGLFGGLITHKFDLVISSVTILEERKEKMAFSIPYLKSGLAFVVRRDMEGVDSVDDIRKRRLLTGAQVGTTSYFYLEKDPDFKVKGYQVYGHAVTDLINGEIDAVLGESSATLYYKNRQKDYFQKIRMVGDIVTDENYGIVLRKDDPELLEEIDTALAQLLADGTVKTLHEKWELGRAASVPGETPAPVGQTGSSPSGNSGSIGNN